MASNKTPNLGLDIWQPDDFFKRAEVNNNFTKIDEKVAYHSGKIDILSRIQATIDNYPKVVPELDDTPRIKRLIAYAKANGYKKVVLTDGSYEISDTIYGAVEGEKLGVLIEGVNAETVEIVVNVEGSKAAFAFEKIVNNVEGWDERWSNGGLKNLRIRAKNRDNMGTGIYVRGSVFAQFDNVRITNMKYGVWLHNDKKGIYTELNSFANMRIDFCDNNIRIERNLVLDANGGVLEDNLNTGEESFHGNIFDKIYMNVKPGKVGFNMVSGMLYNARFDLFMWAQYKGKDTNGNIIQPTGEERPVYINVGSTAICKTSTGTMTFEGYAEGRLTGSGQFWVHGTIDGIGPYLFVDETVVKSNGERVFSFDNHFQTKQLGTYDLYTEPVVPYNQRKNREGLGGMLMRIIRTTAGNADRWLDSLLALSRNGSPANNGFYVGGIPNNADESQATLGFFLSNNGQYLRSYKDTGLEIYHKNGPNEYLCGKFANGSFQTAKAKTQVVPANPGVQQTFYFSAYNDPNVVFDFYFRIYGTSFESRKVYRTNVPHPSQGTQTLTATQTFYESPKTGVIINSVKAQTAGDIRLDITTDIPLIIEYRTNGIGVL
ncbi:hypothetical protein [Priestia megaterium]